MDRRCGDRLFLRPTYWIGGSMNARLDIGSALAVLALLVAGCANNPSTQAAAVREVDATQVGKCALISNITGKSLLAGGVATSAVNAMTDAKEQAAGLGANVVVIQSLDGGSMYAPATAKVKAYRCN
jgi:hypothetical protein